MPPTLTSALATPFTHTTAAPDVVVTWASGASPCNITLATGSYRMALAPTTGTVTDYLRALATAMQTAILATRTPAIYSVTCTLSAAGIATLEINSDISTVPATITLAASVWQRLGMASATPFVTVGKYSTAVGVRPVWHLATFVERVSADWSQRTPIAAAETIAGAGYGVTSGVTSWTDEIAFGFIPRDPDYRTSLAVDQTPWEPDAAYLTTPGTLAARTYSVSDLLVESLGAEVAFAAGNFQTLLSSTSARYNRATIPGREIGAPRLARLVTGWDAYRRWTTVILRRSTATGTRA